VPEDLFEEHPDSRVADGGIAHRGTGSDQTNCPNQGSLRITASQKNLAGLLEEINRTGDLLQGEDQGRSKSGYRSRAQSPPA
jgi:hypothetical protein